MRKQNPETEHLAIVVADIDFIVRVNLKLRTFTCRFFSCSMQRTLKEVFDTTMTEMKKYVKSLKATYRVMVQ